MGQVGLIEYQRELSLTLQKILRQLNGALHVFQFIHSNFSVDSTRDKYVNKTHQLVCTLYIQDM